MSKNFAMQKVKLSIIIILFPLIGLNQEISSQKIALNIYAFCKLLQWPEYNNNTIEVNIYKDVNITHQINILDKTAPHTKRIIAKQTDVPTFCNLIFVPKAYLNEFSTKVDFIINKPIVIVTDLQGATELYNWIDIEIFTIKKEYSDPISAYKIKVDRILRKNIRPLPELLGYSKIY